MAKQTPIQLLSDIANHLEQGAALWAGSLIFEEDKPALEVIRETIAREQKTG